MAVILDSAVLEMKADITHLKTGMEKAQKTVTSTVNNIKRTLLGLAAAYASFETVRGFASMTRDAIIASDNIGKLAEKLSITTEELSRLQYAAGYADVSIDKISSAMSAMIRRTNNFVQYGTGAAAKAYKELGISQDEARQKMTSTNEAFFFLIDRLSKVKDSYHRTAIAQDLFSKSAADVIRLSNMGADELKRLAKEADDLGLTVTTAQYNMSASFDDTVDHIKKVGEGYKRTFLLEALPAALAFAETFDKTFTESLKNASKETSSYGNLVTTVLKGAVSSFYYLNKGIDVVTATLKLGLLGILEFANLISKAINTLVKGVESAMIFLGSAYNDLADIAGFSKVSLPDIEKDFIDTTWTDNAIKSLWENVTKQSEEWSKTSAKKQAENFVKEFTKNLNKANQDGTAKETLKKTAEAYKQYMSADEWEMYFEKIGDYEKAWLIKRAELMSKYSHFGKEELEKLLKAEEKAYFESHKKKTVFHTKSAKDLLKTQKDLLKKQKKAWQDHFSYVETEWDDTVKTMSESLEKNFFDLLDGKFTSLKDMFKNFANDVFVTPMKQDLSKYLSSGTLSLLGQNTVNGQTLDSYLGSQGYKEIGGDFVKWIGDSKVVIDKTGKVLQGQDKVSKNTLNDLTNLKSGYDAVIGGIQSSIIKPFANAGTILSNMGYTNAGMGVANYGVGLANPFQANLVSASGGWGSWAGAGAGLGQMTTGAGVGYAVGSIGDKLFGADTKAGEYGAIGGAIGTAIAPGIGTAIGSALGSLVGGLFGSTKLTGTGFKFDNSINASNVQSYEDYKKKSWFSSSSWTNYKDLDSATSEMLNKLFSTYDLLLASVYNIDDKVTLTGKISAKDLGKNFVKEFFGKIITDTYNTTETISKTSVTDFGEIIQETVEKIVTHQKSEKYVKIWEDYAKNLNKDINEVIADEFNKAMQTKRDFTLWKDKSNHKNYLKDTFKFAQDDLKNIQDVYDLKTVKGIEFVKSKHGLGTGVAYKDIDLTADNFQKYYDAMLKTNPTPETIHKWEVLGKALMKAGDAQKAYNDYLKSLTDEITKYSRSYHEWYVSFTSTDDKALKDKAISSKKDLEDLYKNNTAFVGVTIDNFEKLFNTIKGSSFTTEQTIKNWEELGNALRNNSEAQKAYNDYLKNEQINSLNKQLSDKQKALNGLQNTYNKQLSDLNNSLNNVLNTISNYTNALAQSIRNEINRVRQDYSARSSVISSLQGAMQQYLPTKTYDYTSISQAVNNLDYKSSYKDSANVAKDIDSWYKQQVDNIKAVDDLNRQRYLDEQEAIYQSQVARIDSLNKEIELNNQLRDTILKVKEDINNYAFGVNTQEQARSSFQTALQNKDWDNLTDSFKTYVDFVKSSNTTSLDKFLTIAYANRDVQAVNTPDYKSPLEEPIKNIAEYSSNIDTQIQDVKDKAKGLYEELITNNEKSLPNINDTIKILLEENRKYFGENSDIVQYLERGATDLTYIEQMQKERELLDTNFAKQNEIQQQIVTVNNNQESEIGQLRNTINSLTSTINSLKEELAGVKEATEKVAENTEKTADNTDDTTSVIRRVA